MNPTSRCTSFLSFILSYHSKLNVIAVILLLSVVVRLPNIDRPLSKHHEFCTAMALITFDVWNEKGAVHFHYSPVTNYQNPPDLHINNGTIPFIKNGTHYYLSHPPLGFWLPYYSFQLLGLSHSNRNLQYFNLLFHLLAALCVYSIMQMMYGSFSKEKTSNTTTSTSQLSTSQSVLTPPISPYINPATIATSIYLLSPAMLWYGSNVYFSDIFVNQLFVIAIWGGMKVEKNLQSHWSNSSNGNTRPPKHLYFQSIWVSLLLLATLLTEWIGYFLGASMAAYTCWQFFKTSEKGKKQWYAVQIVWTVLAVIGGITITFGIYSQILGLDAFVEYLQNRFLTRTGQDDGMGKMGVWLFYAKQLLQHYASAYLPVLLLMLGLCALHWRKRKGMRKNQEKASIGGENRFLYRYFVWVALPPIFLHHFLFINYTAIHEYAIVKMCLPIAIAVAYLYQKALQYQWISTKWLKTAFLLTLCFCLLQYFYINRVGEHSWRGHRYDQFQKLGAKIQVTAEEDEMVFVKGDIEINFQLVYYAKRNIWRYKNPEQMQEVLSHFGQTKGVVVEVETP